MHSRKELPGVSREGSEFKVSRVGPVRGPSTFLEVDNDTISHQLHKKLWSGI